MGASTPPPPPSNAAARPRPPTGQKGTATTAVLHPAYAPTETPKARESYPTRERAYGVVGGPPAAPAVVTGNRLRGVVETGLSSPEAYRR